MHAASVVPLVYDGKLLFSDPKLRIMGHLWVLPQTPRTGAQGTEPPTFLKPSGGILTDLV